MWNAISRFVENIQTTFHRKKDQAIETVQDSFIPKLKPIIPKLKPSLIFVLGIVVGLLFGVVFEEQIIDFYSYNILQNKPRVLVSLTSTVIYPNNETIDLLSDGRSYLNSALPYLYEFNTYENIVFNPFTEINFSSVNETFCFITAPTRIFLESKESKTASFTYDYRVEELGRGEPYLYHDIMLHNLGKVKIENLRFRICFDGLVDLSPDQFNVFSAEGECIIGEKDILLPDDKYVINFELSDVSIEDFNPDQIYNELEIRYYKGELYQERVNFSQNVFMNTYVIGIQNCEFSSRSLSIEKRILLNKKTGEATAEYDLVS